MKRTFKELLASRTVLLDGGMGSGLIAMGLQSGGCPELWNLERPDLVQKIHGNYYEAGSDVVQTNTFGGSALALRRHALAEKMESLNLAAAAIARQAADRMPDPSERYVAGNIGPSGLFLPPVGNAEPAELEDAFAAQASVLAKGGVDYISIETMTDLKEALLALEGVRRMTDLPVTVCLTFEMKKRGFFTMMGNSPRDAAASLVDAGADAVGANCSVESKAMLEACPLFFEGSSVPVVLKPNAGLPEMERGLPVYRQDPADFARDVAAMADMGARAVGGCCGTDRHFIAALRRELDARCGRSDA